MSSFGGGGGGTDDLQQHLEDVNAARRRKQNDIIDETKGPLSYFYGKNPTDTGLYKDYVRTGTESTARAYDDARANVRSRANTAGFGYTSPIANAGETELSNEEAKSMADVPATALKSTIAPELAALSLRSGQAGYYGDAPSYSGQAVDLSKYNQTRKDQSSAGMTDALTQALMMMAMAA